MSPWRLLSNAASARYCSYGLLLSEDNALMLGSLLLFAVLSSIMTLTRRIDWHAVSAAWQPLREKAAEHTEAEPPVGE
jgi:inner membrane protein